MVGYIAVLPEWRRAGVARYLFSYELKRLRRAGVGYLLGEVEMYGRREAREHLKLLCQAEGGKLSRRARLRMAELEVKRQRVIAMGKLGFQLVDRFPYFQPDVGGGVFPMHLVVLPVRAKVRTLDGQELLSRLKIIHENEVIYKNNMSAYPRIRMRVLRHRRQGKSSYKVIRLSPVNLQSVPVMIL